MYSDYFNFIGNPFLIDTKFSNLSKSTMIGYKQKVKFLLARLAIKS
jgi:hypothetical protein